MKNPGEMDTIAAIATAPGEAGIGIVRISGGESERILKEIYRGKTGEKRRVFEPRKLYYGIVEDIKGNAIDEALCVFMKGPFSYTGEDVVEVQCHGGSMSVKEILRVALQKGARVAEAGEFTKRAFLNGRIDLAQAEAVMEIISAKTGRSLNAAVGQLGGKISDQVKEIMSIEVELIANIEAGIDFPEHDIEELSLEKINEGLQLSKKKLEILMEGFEEGRLIKDGVKAAIVGKPNVGKSSLLNALIRESKAIVTDIPGTTRDIIEETLNIDGILIRLLDTAGLRQTEDVVESIGVERTKKAIEEADLVLMVLDRSGSFEKEDEELAELLTGKKVLLILNKCDLDERMNIEAHFEKVKAIEVLEVSAKEELGLTQVEETIRKMVETGTINSNGNIPVTNERHRQLIEKAYDEIRKALEGIEIGVPLDLVSIDIRNSWEKLGDILGESVTGDVASEIFSRFCVGK